MMQNKELASNEPSRSDSISLAQRFLTAAVQIEIFGREIGITIAPTDNKLPLFKALPLEQQKEVVLKIERNFDIFASVIREKQDLRSSFSLVWLACSRLGLRPPSDFFDKISDDDVVQVFSQEGIHRFSNFKFFEICSYTLEQIYTVPWNLLWMRPEKEMAFMMAAAAKALGPDQKTTVMYNAPPHRVYELSSVFKYELEYSLKCIAPLFDRATGERGGFIVCESGRLLNKHTPLEEERMLLEVESRVKAPPELRSLS